MLKIVGYSDQISVAPAQTIKFMVSCDGVGSYRAEIVRLVCGDSNPKGPGVKEEPVDTSVNGTYRGRKQEVHAGSFGVIPASPVLDQLGSFSVQCMIWPTTPDKAAQGLITKWSEETNAGFALMIDASGAIALRIADGQGREEVISTQKPLLSHQWYFVGATFDAEKKAARVFQAPLLDHAKLDLAGKVETRTEVALSNPQETPLIFAGFFGGADNGRIRAINLFNGRIDSPRLFRVALAQEDMAAMQSWPLPEPLRGTLVAAWDFSKDIPGVRISDLSANGLHGELVNLPARAVTGYNWTGEEMNWRHVPDQYGAVHFHDDDLYDARWETDFELVIPAGLKSGLYAARLRSGEQEEYIPFVVRPGRDQPRARAVFLVPTASYMAYANDHSPTNAALSEIEIGQVTVLSLQDEFMNMHREYGASLYDTHSDGSGVCYSSRFRPILNMRPKYSGWLGGYGSSLWQFNADTHIIDWLEAKGFDYDALTDEDLNQDGADALAPYQVLITGTHPEYFSTRMREAVEAFKSHGGRLMYLGGNGWYWRIAFHTSLPGIIEVRRAEGGLRAWEARPGEYHHSFTGEYGGLWRRQGLPPQAALGTGFSAQGFDVGSYFRRMPDSFDPRAQFIFEGVGEDERIGDFGLIGGGAAGLELDRFDRALGTPPNTLLLASSEGHTDTYVVVPEEILINSPALTGSQSELVRADMVFFETPGGGAVFSASSISWAGSLSHNSYDNNVSRITGNVLRRFLDPTPF